MKIPSLPLVAGTIALIAAPAFAQDIGGILRISGDVEINSNGGYVGATDKQPVVAGQKLRLAEGARATVEFGVDCKRIYDTAGVHTITPADCKKKKDNDDKNNDGSSGGNGSAQGLSNLAKASIGLASGVIVAARINQNRKDNPTSP